MPPLFRRYGGFFVVKPFSWYVLYWNRLRLAAGWVMAGPHEEVSRLVVHVPLFNRAGLAFLRYLALGEIIAGVKGLGCPVTAWLRCRWSGSALSPLLFQSN